MRGAAPSARPASVLVDAYADRGDYVDCFAVDVPHAAGIADLIDGFFGSRAFQPERWLLTAIGRPSNSAELSALASGERNAIAAWTVEARNAHEILLCDFLKFTRCWLMVQPTPAGSKLHFGTVFARRERQTVGLSILHAVFAALRPLHSLYARTLLNSARARLMRRRRAGGAPAGP